MALQFDDIVKAQSGMTREDLANTAQSISPVARYTNPQPMTTGSPVIQPTPPQPPTVTKPQLGTVDEASIREQTRQRMQSSIDAINAQFANLIQQEQVAGEDRSGQTRAISARSGLMGSDFGQAHQVKTQQFNQQQVKYLEDEKTARVNSVMQNIEDRASAEIQMRKQEALGQFERDMAEFERVQEQARGDLQVLAQSGVALEQLNPMQREALFKQAGYEDTAFGELIYNAMRPKPQQIEYESINVGGGRVLFYGVDPQTGELKQKVVDLGLPDEWSMTIAPDGTALAFNKNTGETSLLSGQGQFAKPDDPLDQALKQAQIEKIYNDIALGQGAGILSIEEATKLGVPYGTTKEQAVGIMPGQGEQFVKIKAGLDEAQMTKDLISELLNHPGIGGATGAFPGASATIFSKSKDFAAKFDRLIALLQLQNISKLKGTGPITDKEQEVLKNAATSLRRNVHKDIVVNELKRLQTSTENIIGELTEKQTSLQPGTINEFEQQYQNYYGPPNPNFKQGGSTPYLKTLGAITGLDGSKYWKWGLDVDLKKGDPVKSPVNGTILATKTSPTGFGLQVRIKADDGTELWLSHLDGFKVKPGQRIAAGQLIGLGGNTGKVYSPGGGDGSHLDITIPKSGGGYLTARQVKAYLDKQFV